MGSDKYFELIASIRLDLLELFGSGYVIEHCISTLCIQQKEKQYKVYVTDCLKIIAENTAKYSGGTYLKERFFDLFDDSKPKDTRSGDEIVRDIIKRAGLTVAEGGE